MKKFIKYTMLTILIIIFILTLIWNFYLKGREINEDKTVLPVVDIEHTLPNSSNNSNEDVDLKQVDKSIINFDYDKGKQKLQKLVSESDRVNLVLFSHDGSRADTIMFISFNPEHKKLDVINIPRDTYWRVEGYTDTIGKQKINAVYGRGNNLGGSKGVKEAIVNLLQIPIHYFVKVDYDGAANIIDSLGGVEVNVERGIFYDDIYCDPPFHVDIKAGNHLLNGENGVKYLRWRKNNDGYEESDLQRIERMQAFAKKVLKKVISPKLPSFIKTCFENIYTDIELELALSYAIKGVGIEGDDIAFETMPGAVEGYYYVCDLDKTQELFIQMYSKK